MIYNATLDMVKIDKHVDSQDIKNIGINGAICIAYKQYLDKPCTPVSFTLSNWTPVAMATFWKIGW